MKKMKILQNKSLILTFALLLFNYGLWTMPACRPGRDYGLIYAQNVTIEDGDLEVNSPSSEQRYGIIFKQQAQPGTAITGQIYYDNADKYFYRDNAGWKELGGGLYDKTVATKIIGVKRTPSNPALDSLDSSRADVVCTGSNDQQTIQTAIDELSAAGRHAGAIYFLEGTYNLSSFIQLKSGISLIGAGPATILKTTNGGAYNCVLYATTATNVQISHLAINANSAVGSGIYFSGATDSKIENVEIINTNDSVGESGGGIYFALGANNNTISQCIIRANLTNGISFVSSASSNFITDNIIESNSRRGIFFQDAGVANNIIANNIINTNNTGGVYFKNGPKNNIMRNNNISNTSSKNYPHIGIQGYNNASGNMIDTNILYSNATYGVQLEASAPNNRVSGNLISSNGICGIEVNSDKNMISKNMLVQNPIGIKLLGASGAGDSSIVSFNWIDAVSGSGNFGIYTDTTASGNYLVGNLTLEETYSPIFSQEISDNYTPGTTKYTYYTQKDKISFERSAVRSLTLANPNIVPFSIQSPTNYIPVRRAASGGVNAILADGKTRGEILILEGAGIGNDYFVRILEADNPNLSLKGTADRRFLRQYDILVLMWDGGKWIELDYSDNGDPSFGTVPYCVANEEANY